MGQEEIQSYLVEIWPKSAREGEVARAVGKTPQTAADQLKSLINKGTVEKLARGEYRANIDALTYQAIESKTREAQEAELLPVIRGFRAEIQTAYEELMARRRKSNRIMGLLAAATLGGLLISLAYLGII